MFAFMLNLLVNFKQSYEIYIHIKIFILEMLSFRVMLVNSMDGKGNRNPDVFRLSILPSLARWPICLGQLPSVPQDDYMSHQMTKGRKSVSHGPYLLKEQRNHSQKLPSRLCLSSYWPEHYYMLVSKAVIGKGIGITLMGLSELELSQGFVDNEKMGELVIHRQ